MKKVTSKTNEKKSSKSMYTLKVTLLNGPVSDDFIEENSEVSRIIQILGIQTLEHLHDAIFTAYDRFDEHLYEFQFGKKLHAIDNIRYILPYEASDLTASKNIAGSVRKTSIDSLNLKPRQTFFYWFDFGDDWIHKINVVSIDTEFPEGKYPKIIARVGDSPPQYAEWEEEEEEDTDRDSDDKEKDYDDLYKKENHDEYDDSISNYYDDDHNE